MLLEFLCSNFRSIKNEILFSSIASSDTSLSNNIQQVGNIRVLKSEVIYGANGSGKSSFINAIALIKELVTESVLYAPDSKINHFPHKLNTSDVDTTFKLQFIYDNTRYAYGVSIQKGEVLEEYLYHFPNKKRAKIFVRTGAEKYIEGNEFKGKLKICNNTLSKNKLLLSCAARLTKIQPIINAYRFFDTQLVFYTREYEYTWLQYTLKYILQYKYIHDLIINICTYIGIKIKDINVITKQSNNEEIIIYDAIINYGQFNILLLSEESDGIRRLFSFFGPIIDVLINGKVLLCDELETSLHESLVIELVKLFLTFKQSLCQLIFTTHNTNILSTNLFRRDQIWLTELNPDDRSTNLYSLAELKDIRKTENLARGYIMGRYGALPILNRQLATDIINQVHGASTIFKS